ncbi:hypothetical protein ACOR62_09485 [Neisseria lisongii]|uniref:hypothetical protein n=1 Tax=Neisseria lisongii TaxID=2912188 RepID=UPI001F268B0D|nr:hypothetical protein [Neisseria lisongii]
MAVLAKPSFSDGMNPCGTTIQKLITPGRLIDVHVQYRRSCRRRTENGIWAVKPPCLVSAY